MSTTKENVETQSKEDIENEAYAVIEATNDDGTIDGEIISTPVREGDDVVFEVMPLTPTHESKEIRMNWPKKESINYDIVRLCENKVGGFQSIAELKNEKVKIKICEDSEDFNLVVEDRNDEDNKYIQSIEKLSVAKFLTWSIFGFSILGIIFPIGLVLAVPWGISILSFWQGVSVLVLSVIVAFISALFLESIYDL